MADPQARFILSAEDRTRAAILSAQGNMERLGKTARSVATVLGGAFAIRGASRLTTDALKMADAIGEVATKAGVSATQLQVLRFAAEQNGGSAEKLDSALIKLNTNLGQAALEARGLADSGGPAAEALERLGISVLTAGGQARTTGDLFPELVDRLAAIESPAERASLAARIFGESIGPELAGVIAEGSAALARYLADLERFRGLLSEELIAAAGKTKDAFDALGFAFSTNLKAGVVQGFAGEVDSLKAVTEDPEFVENVNELGRTFGGFLRIILEQGPRALAILNGIARAWKAPFAGGRVLLERVGLIDPAPAAPGPQPVIETSKERVEAEEQHTTRLKALKASETEALRVELERQQKLYADANAAIAKNLDERARIEEEFGALVERAKRGGSGDREPSFLDVASTRLSARQALDAGQFERAIELARQAADQLDRLQESGKGGGLAELFEAKQLEEIAKAANQRQGDALEAQKAKVEAAIAHIKGLEKTLQNLKVTFDTAKAITDAKSLRQAIENELKKNPITIPVQVQQAPTTPAAPVPGRASGGYLPGWSPHARADNILFRGTAGEYVLPVDAVQRITRERGAWVLEALRRGTVPAYAFGGLLGGPRPVDLSGMAAAVANRPERAPGAVINLTLPGGEQFTVGADLDVAQALAAAVRREALKGGRRG